MKIRAAAGFLLLAMVAAPLWPKPAHPARPAEATYVDPTLGYSITYPANWQFKPPNADGRIFITSPVDGPNDNFRENLNLAPRNFSEPSFDARKACPAFLKGFAQNYEAYVPGKCEYAMWNGVEAMRIDYAFDKTDDGIVRHIHVYQTIAVKNAKLYVVTFTAVESTYARYLPIANRMMASIKIP